MIVRQKENGQGNGGSNYSVRPALKKKSVVLLILLAVAVAATLLVYKYFYYLDAYYYTCEFYWLFNVKNLQTANAAIFTEFFSPMSITSEALPQIILSNLIQNYYLPFTKPILVRAITGAFGPGLGSLFSFLGFFVVGLLSFGIGSFFFGDMLPYIKKGGLEQYRKTLVRPAAITFPLLFAIPFIPVSVVAIGGAAMKISLRELTRFMLPGLIVRVFWLLCMALLYHDISAVLLN